MSMQISYKVVDRYTLQSFTDPGCKQKLNVPERKVWMVQYNGPFPLENWRISPTQMCHNEQTSSDDIKEAVKDMR